MKNTKDNQTANGEPSAACDGRRETAESEECEACLGEGERRTWDADGELDVSECFRCTVQTTFEPLSASDLFGSDLHKTMKEAKIELTLKPCGDCWLHIDAPSGLRASINLGQRGSMNDNIIVGRTIQITKNSQFQANTFTTDDVCQRCMKSLASIIADGIESLDRWIELSDEEKEETRIFG